MEYLKLDDGTIDWKQMCLLYEEFIVDKGFSESNFDEWMNKYHSYLLKEKQGSEKQ